MDNLSPIVEISAATADSLTSLIPQEVSENLALSTAQGTATNRPSNVPTLLDADGNLLRNWSTAGVFTDTLRTFLQEMDVDWENEQFTEATKIQLQKMLAEVRANDDYNTIVFGVSGKNRRRKLLSNPI